MDFMDFTKNMNLHAILKMVFKILPFLRFLITQRAVKFWIIANANLLEFIIFKDFFLHFERKALKSKLQKGHFGELQFLQTLSMKWGVLTL